MPSDSNRARLSPDRVIAARDHFWQNMVIETLTTFAVIAHENRADTNGDGHEDPASADGRFGVITRLGQRIPIASVTPMLACSIVGSDEKRSLSEAVQCSIFQILTPSGEMHTVPASEITGFHALTPELIEQLGAAQHAAGAEDNGEPFGFAAFTSLAQSEREARAAAEAEANAEASAEA